MNELTLTKILFHFNVKKDSMPILRSSNLINQFFIFFDTQLKTKNSAKQFDGAFCYKIEFITSKELFEQNSQTYQQREPYIRLRRG